MKPFNLFCPTCMIIFLINATLPLHQANSCSTFKLQTEQTLLYGHNLNEGDIGVPGLLMVNKRGIFKLGRSWSQIHSVSGDNPSNFQWISRYGSVTFNNFGRDFPDGGINETGMYIWEMNEVAEYPQNEHHPRLNQMQWMQYVLDTCSTVEEAITVAGQCSIDGWGWHFFVADRNGETAAISFTNGKVNVVTGPEMPVPALFNTPYKRELEIAKYYTNFGGLYEVNMPDPEVPRFVKTAKLIHDYSQEQDPIEYGFYMLDRIQVSDLPEWSILYDSHNRKLYFRTRLNPSIKSLDFATLDFSNQKPTQLLNIDSEKGGEVLGKLEPYSHEKIKNFTIESMIPVIGEAFFTSGGLTIDQYLDRITEHTKTAESGLFQVFTGTWTNGISRNEDERQITLTLQSNKDAITGLISISSKSSTPYKIDHLYSVGETVYFTFKTKNNIFLEGRAQVKDQTIKLSLEGTEFHLGNYVLEAA